ncbi:unnamed protein product [Rotaria sp. Silwood1]|nr:unnamed protein product [Rotaria sp. Silwood1]
MLRFKGVGIGNPLFTTKRVTLRLCVKCLPGDTNDHFVTIQGAPFGLTVRLSVNVVENGVSTDLTGHKQAHISCATQKVINVSTINNDISFDIPCTNGSRLGPEFCLTYQPEYATTLETWCPLTVDNFDTTKNVHHIISSAAANCPLHIQLERELLNYDPIIFNAIDWFLEHRGEVIITVPEATLGNLFHDPVWHLVLPEGTPRPANRRIFLLHKCANIQIRKNVEKKLYGSRLIVNDEDKSKQNSPQTKSTTVILPSIHSNDYTIITKQRKNSQIPCANSPSTTDAEFSSSLLSCPFNGTSSSSTSDLDRSHNNNNNNHHHHHNHQNLPSSTVSALTTLTRKSTRRQQTKNVSFQATLTNPTNNVFNDLFQNTSSTFSTLPKQTKHDISIANINQNSPILTDLPRTQSNDFPTLQTILNPSIKDIQTKLPQPQPPPLLNGILLLDKMLAKSSITNNNEKKHTISPSSSTISNSGWYNVTSNYQTRASIV